MESTRDRLAQHLLKRVVPLFKLGNLKYDPWWWPIGTGKCWDDWFPALTQDEVEGAAGRSKDCLLASLRKGPRKQTPVPVNPEDYAQFHGFWGEARVDGRMIAIVSIRPSRRPYPANGWPCFPRLLHAIGCGGVHVTDIIKRRGPGREPLTDFTSGDSAGNYVGMLVEELAALAYGQTALHIIPMHPEARQLLQDPNCNAIDVLTERLGWRPTLYQRRLPFPKDPDCEEKIGTWRKVLDDSAADEKGKRALKEARAVLGKKPRGFWKDASVQALLRSEASADEVARDILGRLRPGVKEEDFPRALDLTRADAVWYRNHFKIPQRDDDATVRTYLRTYAALK